MKVVIIEDEVNAFEYLQSLLGRLDSTIEIIAHMDSVKSSVNYFQTGLESDLVFMDIQIADGLSFEIFNHAPVKSPIIFTTAYDQYAIDAFKVHSIDYLLKPIHFEELKKSMDKYYSIYKHGNMKSSDQVLKMLQKMTRPKKNRCLVKKGGHYEYVPVEQISYVISEDSITFLYTMDGIRFIYAKTVEQLYDELDQDYFYQINRSQLVNSEAIMEVHPFLNQRLKLKLKTKSSDQHDFIVSRQRMTSFKEWMDR